MPLNTITPQTDTELRIIDDLVNGLRNKIRTQTMVYAQTAPLYIDGSMGERCIQVCPAETVNVGEADGGQDGGTLLQRMVITLGLWYRVKEDMHARSDQMLTEDTFGVLSWRKQIKDLLGLTMLSSNTDGSHVLLIPLRFVGQSSFTWDDEDNGWSKGTMTYLADFGNVLPTSITMTPADCLPIVQG